MPDRVSPSERIERHFSDRREKEQADAPIREEVLETAEQFAVEWPEGCEAKIERKTTSPGHSHLYTYTYEHDDMGAHRVGRKVEWAVGGVDDFTWTFDRDLPEPIFDVLSNNAFFNRETTEGWVELHTVMNGLAAAMVSRAEAGV